MASESGAAAPDETRKDEVASVAGQVARLTTGDRAALRRLYLTGSQEADGIVVGLLHRAGVPDAGWRAPAAFSRWRLLAHVAAVLSGTAAVPPHAPGKRLGRALHAAGFSENRLMRLTAARGAALDDQVTRAARYLAQAGQIPVDLWTVRDLVGADRDRAEVARLRIARDYYAAEHANGKGKRVTPKFIQIHFLAAWPGALLNRDDAGLAKRLPFGRATRTRVSSQCLKRHWRMADDPRALHALAAEQGVESERSKIAIEREVTDGLRDAYAADIVEAVELAFAKAVYGDKAKVFDGSSASIRERQALLLGRPELNYLRENAEQIIASAASAKEAKAAAEAWFKDGDGKANFKQMKAQNALAPGLESALFGRMVTSDTRANTDAAIHVAHAFTVHEEQPELDYFTVVDDLRSREVGDDAGAAGVFDTEITSGLYYGYVVVDVPLLVSNLTGCDRRDWAGDQDRGLAARVVENLVWLIAEVSPGAKRGSTAPYSRAELLLVEAGDRQPRTLANAFRDPVPLDGRLNESLGRRTAAAMAAHLGGLDAMYVTGEARRHAALPDLRLDGVEHDPLPGLAAWAGGIVRDAACR